MPPQRQQPRSVDRVTDYRPVSALSQPHLIEQVKAALTEGWQPQGGIAPMYDGRNWIYVQAMVKTV